ncbi:MAG: hypothetical protein ACAI44_12685 [Candidatus Sericytochromatia bacterium]
MIFLGLGPLVWPGGVGAQEVAPERTLAFKITSKMWDPITRKAVPTPPVLVEKIRKVFALWESVPGTGLHFRYDGFAAPAYDSIESVPADGRIYLVLNTRYPMGKFVAGAGGYAGSVPDSYRKGYVFFNTRAGLNALRFATLIHETGHALGLSHGASIDSQMYCGSQLWDGHEFLAFSEQDRAALLQAWNKQSIFTLAGRVKRADPNQDYLVHAVNVRNGRTFAVLGNDPEGNFEIPVLAPGEYRLFAKSDESGSYESRAGYLPSWYLGQGRSSNDPYAGTVIALSGAQPAVSGLELPLIQRRVPFNFWWSALFPRAGGADVPAFLRPGRPVSFELIHNGGAITRLESYGTQPDYTFSQFGFDRARAAYRLTVQASPDAEPGHRLALARSLDGTVQAGLVGIHIISQALPGVLSQDVAEQISQNLSAAALPADYWKSPEADLRL